MCLYEPINGCYPTLSFCNMYGLNCEGCPYSEFITGEEKVNAPSYEEEAKEMEETLKTEERVKPTAITRQKKPKDDDISTYQEYSYMRHPDRVEMGTY